MRTVRTRKKKLIVAFHFLLANQAAWKCDDCRARGLDEQRKCGYLGRPEEPQGRPVWIRRQAVSHRCPRSSVTAESAAWLDQFFVWKTGGGASLADMPARTAEAFLVLEREWRLELEHAEQ